MAAKQKPCLRGVLFDWDGTLIDSYHADTSAYLAMFKEMGIPWGIEELERHYSPNWYQVYRAAKLPRKLWNAADRTWRAHYAKYRPQLIRGARRVLEAVIRKRSEEHTSELQSQSNLVCRLLLEKKKTKLYIRLTCGTKHV